MWFLSFLFGTLFGDKLFGIQLDRLFGISDRFFGVDTLISALVGESVAAPTLLTTDQIAALSTDQVQALSTTVIASLTTDQIYAFTTDGIAALLPGQLAAVSTAAVPGLTTDQVVALTTLQVSGLPSGTLNALNSAQVAAIETVDIQALTTGQISNLSSGALQALTTDQIAAIETADVAALKTAQVAALTTDQIVALSTAQIRALTTAAVAALSTAQIVAIETQDIAALTTRQIVAIETRDIVALTTDQLGALTSNQLNALTPAQLAVLPFNIDLLTTAQVALLTTAQIAALTTDQIVSLETDQAAAISTAGIAALTTDAIGAFETADLAALTSDQIAAFTSGQTWAFSVTQVQGFTSAQIGAFTTSAYQQLATPIILDLNGDGVRTLGLEAGVRFDLFADGFGVNTGWVSGGDGLLVMDRNRDGQITDGSELFGSSTQLASGEKAPDGYVALRELDSNKDGVISSVDAAFADLRVWVDSNSDGVSTSAEIRSLESLGITKISVLASVGSETDNGNLLGLLSSFETVDGQSHDAADVWFRVDRRSSGPRPTSVDSAIAALSNSYAAPAAIVFGAVQDAAYNNLLDMPPSPALVPPVVPLVSSDGLHMQVSSMAQAMGTFTDSVIASSDFSVPPSALGASDGTPAALVVVSMAEVMKQFDANGVLIASPIPSAASAMQALAGPSMQEPNANAVLASASS